MKDIIYIVEDNEYIREILFYILEDEKYDVYVCGSAQKFNFLMAKSLPDVVVLDVMLPDGNGIELCKQIKLQEVTSHIPVIMMSAHSKPEEVIQLSGADVFISKPFDIDFFKDLVTRYLPRKF